MEHSISVSNLSKQYKLGQLHSENMLRAALVNFITHPFQKRRAKNETIWALKDVSFAADEGEIIGIIGRNGAGKSTLLKILSKITHPTTGTMKVNGRLTSLLEVGTGFHEELTGRENIYLNGSILGMRKKETDSKLDEIITFADVEKFIDTPIKRYSSGMRLRLGFSVAAHLQADVLLVDEVLAVGDAEFQKKCLNTMKDLRSGGKTVLFVSHNMAAVENLCQRAIWIDNGQVRQDSNAAEVIGDYLSTFVTAQGAADLRHIETRSGSGDILYTGIEFLDSEKQPQKLLRSGDCLIVRLYYYAKKEIHNPYFGLELYTELGSLITSINTWGAGVDIPLLPPGDGCVELAVDSLNFMPGRYYVSLWLSRVGSIYDRVDYCTTLDVEASDIYQSGRGVDSHLYGSVFLPSRWQVNGLDDASNSTGMAK